MDYSFGDVFGLDPELLMMVPQPCIAMMLLFPINKAHEDNSAIEKEKILKEGQKLPDNIWFMDQTIGNACGTVGLVHAIANNRDKLQLDDGHLKTFFEESKKIPSNERCSMLGETEAIADAHEESANDGQTDAPDLEDRTNLHFICFTAVDGNLFEFDGRKSFPINHGETTSETFLSDAAQLCKTFMTRNPESMEFNITALSKN